MMNEMNRGGALDPEQLRRLGVNVEQLGLVIVDHGSRRAESNRLLEKVVADFKTRLRFPIVEPAHMELAEPSIAHAFASSVEQGATLIVGHPYFLAPGRHWNKDIPELFKEAAKPFPDIRYLVTAPLGPHPLMEQIMQDRILQCLENSLSDSPTGCDICRDSEGGCQLNA